ncbi:HdeD family acid-resistance protein [Streptomyces fragilis]|uniref:HdeD family acid-resistance protein n=1 Tax=Streptomyces fragilis TaxID=67301 RepID=UPI0024DE20B5|nr:HdeD family acid-resistance protein [Streptomyces fragilis]
MSRIRAKDERTRINRSFGWLAVLGVALVIAGIVGLVYTGLATLTSMLLFGWLLLIGGVVGLGHAVQARGTGFFWLGVVVAALNIAAGVVILVRPDAAAVSLTLFAALLFLTGGGFRIVGSLVVRGPQFGWTLVQGAFGLLLGILVLNSWPSDSRYVLGTFFSLALLFDGLGLIATGFGGRNVGGMVTEAERADRGRSLGGDAYYAGRSDAERNVSAEDRTGPEHGDRRAGGDVPPQ